MTDATRYPLSWPLGWKRTAAADRKRSDFSESTIVTRSKTEVVEGRWQRVGRQVKGTKRVTIVTARDRIYDQLGRLGASDWIVSTNVELTRYGEPRGGRSEPDDPGVAAYFELNGKSRVLACDRWETVAENCAAIAAHIDAIRRVDRYGVGTLEQAFAGYDALPPPGAHNRPPWRKVLEIAEDESCSRAAVLAAFRDKAKTLHPDIPGGSHEAMAQLNEARDAALQEIGA